MSKDNIFFPWAHMELSKYLPQVTHLKTRCDFITQRYWQTGTGGTSEEVFTFLFCKGKCIPDPLLSPVS